MDLTNNRKHQGVIAGSVGNAVESLTGILATQLFGKWGRGELRHVGDLRTTEIPAEGALR